MDVYMNLRTKEVDPFKSTLCPNTEDENIFMFSQALADMFNPNTGCNTSITSIRLAGNALGVKGVKPLISSQLLSGKIISSQLFS
jgi:hypothetical protein